VVQDLARIEAGLARHGTGQRNPSRRRLPRPLLLTGAATLTWRISSF
jgi:hypothetical protein